MVWIELRLLVFSVAVFSFSMASWGESGWTVLTDNDPTVVQLKDRFGSCTGTRISKSGHILTARHCLNACLIGGNLVESNRLFPEYGYRSPNLYLFKGQQAGVFCTKELDGVEKELEVLVASPGFMTPSEQGSLWSLDKEKYLSFLEKGYFHNGDFAILKETVTTSQSCRSVSQRSPLEGEPVQYKGFPGKTTGRPEERNSNGEDFLLGEGVITGSILSADCLSRSANQEELVVKYDRPELILSSVDLVPGASGSALLDSEGKILGVLNSAYAQGFSLFGHYCRGNAVAVGIEKVIEVVREQFDHLNTEEIFSCGGVEH